MKQRILLDTNIYGLLLEDKEFFNIFTSLISTSFIIYGSPLIRKELRDLNKNLRNYLLQTYDSLITKENHNLIVNMFVEQLSDAALKAYEQVNKIQGFRNPQYLEYAKFREKVLMRCDI